MEIVIHGTKKGRKIFTPKEMTGLFDVTSDSPKSIAIGQSVYGFRFISNYTIFSKYRIIRDVLGEKRIGFLGFSLFLSKNETLLSKDIITLLNTVSEEYCKNYIVDNNWNEVSEDWSFVERISIEYVNKLQNVAADDIDNIQSGTLDEAFIYYSSDSELQKYFDNPFQEEYRPYRQIFFIENSLKNKPENPINALRNSDKDLTVEIDLDNPFYKLREFHGTEKNGISITIKNSKGRVLPNKDKIYRKEELTVTYTKKYHEKPPIIGSLLNSDEIRKHLIISEDGKKIDVKKDTDFKPIEKTIKFEVVKKDGFRVSNADIRCISDPHIEKRVVNNQLTFSGEELGKSWILSAIHGFYKGQVILTPEEINNEIKVLITSKKKVKLKVLDQNGDIIHHYKVHCKGHKDDNKFLSEIEFTDDEIKDTWNVNISARDNQNSDNKQFCPATDGDEIIFNLIKTKSPANKVEEQTSSDRSINGKDKIENGNTNLKQIIIGSIAMLFLLGIGIWFAFYKEIDKVENTFTSTEIQNYIEGDSLLLNKLNEYQIDWEKQHPTNKEKENILSVLWPYSKKDITTVDLKTWEQTKEIIDSAIYKRTIIDDKKFKELANMNFSFEKQQQFSKTIKKIKISKFKEVDEKLGNVSDLTLTQISSKIDSLLDTKVNGSVPNNNSNEASATSPNTNQRTDRTSRISPTNPDNRNRSSNSNSNNPSPPPTSAAGNNVNKSESNNDKIINYLKSGEIKKIELEKYKLQTNDAALKTSIDLALKFWELDGSRNSSYKTYLEKVNNDSKLKNSVLQKLVTELKKNENSKYVKTITGNAKISLNELKLK